MTMASILLPRLMLALVAMQSDVTVAPPTNALQRYEPKQYDMKFAVNMTTIMPAVDASLRQVIAVRGPGRDRAGTATWFRRLRAADGEALARAASGGGARTGGSRRTPR